MAFYVSFEVELTFKIAENIAASRYFLPFFKAREASMTIFRSQTLLISILIFSAAATASGQQSWTPELQIKVSALSNPQISPDGSRVVYQKNDAVMTADRSEYVSQLWLASIDGKSNFQITFGEKSSSNPKFSPDGTMIAFLSNRKDNRNQIYVLRIAGGEAEQITDGKSAVSDFQWSPDGRFIAYTMSDPKTDEEEKNEKARNDFRWVDENIKFARLYLVPLAKNEAGKREPKKLTDIDRNVTGFDWSPDGRRIVFAHTKSPVADYWPSSDVSTVDIATGAVTDVAAGAAAEQNPLYSPDGKWIAMTVSDLPIRWAQSNRIYVYPAAGGEPKILPPSYDGQPGLLAWSPDSRYVLFTEARGTGTALYGADISAGSISLIESLDAVITSPFSHKSGLYAYVRQTADTPPEVYVGRAGMSAVTRVSSANSSFSAIPTPKTEVIKWKSKDGMEIEGLLTYPVGYRTGTRVPLILNVHGGPAGVFQQSFVGNRGVYPLASMAAAGYAILRPNPRGSSGYGTQFRRANIKDWGGMDYEDLMAGVDHVISMGVADENRLGVMGWSYGGYMTSTIITKTNRFKAASAGAAVTNLMSFNGTADIPSFVPDYFEAEFWDNPEIYARHSAMFNIKNARTPTLIQHGDADVRVPISQGYELYNALKRLGVPVRMIVLPRQPHGPTEPRMQLAAMQSNLEWFAKYLK